MFCANDDGHSGNECVVLSFLDTFDEVQVCMVLNVLFSDVQRNLDDAFI